MNGYNVGIGCVTSSFKLKLQAFLVVFFWWKSANLLINFFPVFLFLTPANFCNTLLIVAGGRNNNLNALWSGFLHLIGHVSHPLIILKCARWWLRGSMSSLMLVDHGLNPVTTRIIIFKSPLSHQLLMLSQVATCAHVRKP